MTDRSAPAHLAERRADRGLVLRRNRPEKRNALATPLLRSVAEVLEVGDGDDATRVTPSTHWGRKLR